MEIGKKEPNFILVTRSEFLELYAYGSCTKRFIRSLSCLKHLFPDEELRKEFLDLVGDDYISTVLVPHGEKGPGCYKVIKEII